MCPTSPMPTPSKYSAAATARCKACLNLLIAKPQMISALIPGEQRQAVLLDGEPLEDGEKLKYVGPMFVANGQGTEEISSRINLAH